MYSRIHQLKENGFKKAQVAQKLGIIVKTVRRMYSLLGIILVIVVLLYYDVSRILKVMGSNLGAGLIFTDPELQRNIMTNWSYAGYIIGYRIMQEFIKNNPEVSIVEWTVMPAKDILGKSGFDWCN